LTKYYPTIKLTSGEKEYDTADSLFERADALLYQSKRKGGNVVTIG
jgi:PleD family two-component response regulator